MKEMRASASSRVIPLSVGPKKIKKIKRQRRRAGGRGGVDPQVSLSSQRDISLSPEKPSPCRGGTL